MRGQMLVKPGLMIFKEARIAHGAFPVRPALGIHLQQAEIHTQLDLLVPVLTLKPADNHLAWLVFPGFKQSRDVIVHRPEYGGENEPSQPPGAPADFDCASSVLPAIRGGEWRKSFMSEFTQVSSRETSSRTFFSRCGRDKSSTSFIMIV